MAGFPQFVSPATIGEQTEFGHVDLSTDIQGRVACHGGTHTFYPARTFVLPFQVLWTEHELLLAQCSNGSLKHPGLDEQLISVGGAFDEDIGEHLVWNWDTRVDPPGWDSSWIPQSHRLHGPKIETDLNNEVCPNVLELLWHRFGYPNSDALVIFEPGSDHSLIGVFDVIGTRFISPLGENHDRVSGAKSVSFQAAILDLLVAECPQSGLWHPMPRVSLERGIAPVGREHAYFGEFWIHNQRDHIYPLGEDHDVFGANTFLALEVYEQYIADVVCSSGAALQHALGEFKTAQLRGVFSELFGTTVLTVLTPRLRVSGLESLLVGNHLVAMPEEKIVLFNGVLSEAFGFAFLDNMVRPLYLQGEGHTQFGDTLVLFLNPSITPSGFVATDAIGTQWVSNWIRFIGRFSAGLTEEIPTTHWVSHWVRTISLEGEVLGGVGQGLVRDVFYGAGAQDQYGRAYVWNNRRSIGPMGVGDTLEFSQTFFLWYRDRTIITRFTAGHDQYGVPSLRRSFRYAPIPGKTHTFVNTTRPRVWIPNDTLRARGLSQTIIPYYHIVQRRPGQVLFKGATQTFFGDPFVELGIRHVYPYGTAPWRLIPRPYLKQQPVAAPVGQDQLSVGVVTVKNITQWRGFQGEVLTEHGETWVSFSPRFLGVFPFFSQEVGEHLVRRDAERFYPWGFTSFVQPWDKTYVWEIFLIIGPHSLPEETEYGLPYLRNRNREVHCRTPLQTRYSTPHVWFYTRYIESKGSTTELGHLIVRDSRIQVPFKGAALGSIGHPTIYYGQPWLPTNQMVRPGKVGVPDEDRIGEPLVDWGTKRLYMVGEDLDKFGMEAEVRRAGPTFDSLGRTAKYGTPSLNAALPRIYPETLGDTSRISKKTRIDPWWIFMTCEGNLSTGGEIWHVPDFPDECWKPKGELIGAVRVSNEIRTVYPYHNVFCVDHVPIFGEAKVAYRFPRSGQYLYMHGVRAVPVGVPGLLGGRRAKEMPGDTHTHIGSAKVEIPLWPFEQVLPDMSGADTLWFGDARVELFNRALLAGETLMSDQYGIPWVSRSPRYLDLLDEGVFTEEVGVDSWVSYWIRTLEMVGLDSLYILGYSPEHFKWRLHFRRRRESDMRRVYPYDTDMTNVGLALIHRGSICGP